MDYTIINCLKDHTEIYADVFEGVNCSNNINDFHASESILQVVIPEDKKSRFYILYAESSLSTQIFKILLRDELAKMTYETLDEKKVREIIEKMKKALDKYYLLIKKEDCLTMDNCVAIVSNNKIFLIDGAFSLALPTCCADFGSQFSRFVLDLCPGKTSIEKIRWLKETRGDDANKPYFYGTTNDKKGVTLCYRDNKRIIPWEDFQCRY